jgi:hypothetical protein
MRSIFRSVLVALMAVLALGAVASASASAALPEFSGSFPDTFELKSSITIGTGTRGAIICSSSTQKGLPGHALCPGAPSLAHRS